MRQGQDTFLTREATRPGFDWLGRPLPPPPVATPITDPDDGRGSARPRVQGNPTRRPPPRRQAIRRELASVESLRRAVLLAEVLAPPKALRPPDTG